MNPTESRALRRGSRVYWHGNAADCGVISETSWNAVTITWANGHVATVQHGDMRDIKSAPARDASFGSEVLTFKSL